jgi:hypothetical protein
MTELMLLLTLAQRWLLLSLLVYGVLRQVHQVTRHWEGDARWPWWLPLGLGAVLAAASWIAGRCV